jgi:hypothetical protein
MPLSLGIASGAGFLKNQAEPAALGYRVNYIDNPSFEVNTNGWHQFGSATIARSTGESFTGSASLSVTATTAQSGAQRGNLGTGNMIPLVAGPGTYYISAYVKLASGVASGTYSLRHLQYEEETSVSTVAAGNVGAQSISDTDGWVRLSGSFTKNTSANFAIIRASTATANIGEIFYIDSVMLEKSDTLRSYFDGGSNGFWSGSANASFSGATPY